VALAPGVAIAPGVVLGAAPGCRLVISAGVVLGADAIVQARQGDLVIAPGASLGSGVLVVGHGTIGQHTCIGANSTVINPQLGAAQVVPPGSLVGTPRPAPPGPPAPEYDNGNGQGRNGQSNFPRLHSAASDLAPDAAAPSSPNGNGLDGSALDPGDSNSHTSASPGPNGTPIYGKAQVDRLLKTLFPHRQPLNGAAPENRP
jgi:carbon dioxide concentrating mechanism protein CcmN